MEVAPPSTHHSHLDPSDLRLCLTSRASYGRKYRSTADPTYNPKEKRGDHITRSGSCYRRDPSVEDYSTPLPNRSPELRPLEDLSTGRGCLSLVPENGTPERWSLDIILQNDLPQGINLDIRCQKPLRKQNYLPIFGCLNVSDAVMCRAFPTTLRKAAHAWFKSLQPRSIYSFGQLSDLFQKHFISSRSRTKNLASLLNIVQEKNESLACFLGRFNAATLEIDNLDESVKYTAFLLGLRPTSKFAFSMNKSPPAIEALIKRGQLRKFVTPREGRQQIPLAMKEREDWEENAGTINTISGGLAAGGSSGRARKAYAREVFITSQPPNKKSKTVPVTAITFSNEDSKDIKNPHDDPLVITVRAVNFDVKRVLIDNGRSAEILFYDAFKKMNIPTDRLRKMDTPLYGFSNHPVAAKGIIALPVAIGTPPAQANFMLDFVVVKVPSAYNAILG
ncbi:hypothetical protein RJ639_020005 [Escallonia herrerae]|uniref:Retrotransposon gag domain-containing protein n=1 Tax=Escallonia herrerae TaxID=1293975 RepID=A0AA89AI34_9ASTE|nr:hypothetical protein RJ639_020005 [Escallonia herrerae]